MNNEYFTKDLYDIVYLYERTGITPRIERRLNDRSRKESWAYFPDYDTCIALLAEKPREICEFIDDISYIKTLL